MNNITVIDCIFCGQSLHVENNKLEDHYVDYDIYTTCPMSDLDLDYYKSIVIKYLLNT